MPIIFGIRRRAQRLATVFAVCRLCGRPAAQAVHRVRTFFTLFFIPIVPLASRYVSTCTLCGQAVKTTKEDAEQLVAHAEATAAQDAAPAYPPPAFPPPAVPQAPLAVPAEGEGASGL